MKALGEAKRAERAREHFSKMDLNGDGAVTEDEMMAAREAMKDRHSDRKDGWREKMLERFDTNADGELSDAERAVAHEQAKAKRGEWQKKWKARKGDKAKRPRLDTDRDGIVTRAEYDAMGEALFARMDANGDGMLTKGEGRRHKGPHPEGGRR